MLPDTYKIKRITDDDISPEETFADAASMHATVEIPISRRVFTFSYIGIGLICLFFISRSFSLQVIQGEQYAQIVDQSMRNRYVTPSIRGGILDVRGNPLVGNIPLFDLVIARSDFIRDPAVYAASMSKIADTLGVPLEEISRTVEKNANYGVFALMHDLPQEQAINIKAARMPGVYIVPYARRVYVLGAGAAHLVGYTSKPTPEELEKYSAYEATDKIGHLGLEAQYEKSLQGSRNIFILGSDSEVAELSRSVVGNTLVTTIDRDVQIKAYETMQKVFSEYGVARGAVVIQNVHTGAILGLASMPSFDPNIFEESSDEQAIQKIQSVLNNKNRPLFNRVISGLYSPGSTIKPLFALAGLQEKIVTPSTLVYAGGSIEVPSEIDRTKVYTYRDWKVHGWTDIRKAIAWSVDVYFYALGGGLPGRQAGLPAGQAGYQNIRGLGIDAIARYLHAFRADQKTGVDLPGEAAGFVPTKQWKKETKGESWYVGDTYNVSIGQGDLSVTPLWLSAYVSAIANGGALMRPFIVKEIQNSDGETLERYTPEKIAQIPVDALALTVVREGMRQTITDGTAPMLKDLTVRVAAKTGTAQITSQSPNSLFIVYGPYENPEIAMTILVENIRDSQSLAVRIAHEFLLWYFGNPQ